MEDVRLDLREKFHDLPTKLLSTPGLGRSLIKHRTLENRVCMNKHSKHIERGNDRTRSMFAM